MSNFPDTAEKRRAGMAAFRAQMLQAHKRALAQTTDAEEAAVQRDLIAAIKAAQRKFGESA